MNGKGSKPRPLSVSREKYSSNFDDIFRKSTTVDVKEDERGQYIIFPQTLLDKLDWKEGDDIKWDRESDAYRLTKINDGQAIQ